MKNLSNGVMRHNRTSFSMIYGAYFSALFTVVFLATIFTGCKKEINNTQADEIQSTSAPKSSEANTLNFYSGLQNQTLWELQQARAATAKYRNIENAIKDGYSDISVDVENMGHHYMKAAILDSVFDIRQPEILVYNKDDNGEQQLVAAEYAIPLSYPEPTGFTGNADVWKHDTFFGLWLLHAWVWSYNPDGVFNPTNPLVHLH